MLSKLSPLCDIAEVPSSPASFGSVARVPGAKCTTLTSKLSPCYHEISLSWLNDVASSKEAPYFPERCSWSCQQPKSDTPPRIFHHPPKGRCHHHSCTLTRHKNKHHDQPLHSFSQCCAISRYAISGLVTLVQPPGKSDSVLFSASSSPRPKQSSPVIATSTTTIYTASLYFISP